MGGLIEDRIFEALSTEEMSCLGVQLRLKTIHEPTAYGTVSKHLRKMAKLRQLDREMRGNKYVYWNPLMRKTGK